MSALFLKSVTTEQHTAPERSWLASWFQPHHLVTEALERYRRAFATHPARLVVVNDLLAPQIADRLNRFLSTEAEFQTEYGCYSVEGAVGADHWNLADDADRFFRFRKLITTPQQFQMSPNALTYLQFRKAFQRPEMREFFEKISGLPLGWSDDFGAHSMITGDFLRPHSDDNRDRRLALVIYLSRDWKREFGGVLRVVHPDGSFTEVEPNYNRMIAFDVLSSPAHLVTPVELATEGAPRLSIGGWYHKSG